MACISGKVIAGGNSKVADKEKVTSEEKFIKKIRKVDST